MKIGRIDQFIPQLKGIGQNTSSNEKGFFGKIVAENIDDTHRLSVSKRVNRESDVIINKKNKDEIFEYIDRKHERRTAEAYRILRYMNDNLFRKFGIRGEITSMQWQSYPQNFKTFFVETHDTNSPNKFLIELENGEFLIGETSLCSDAIYELLVSFKEANALNKGKVSVSKLRELFEVFLESIR